MTDNIDHIILPRLWNSLWKLASWPPIQGNIEHQKHVFRLLLETRGGVEFVIKKPPAELKELERRGIWGGTKVLRKLAGLELRRRRLWIELYKIDLQTRTIRESGLIPPAKDSYTDAPDRRQ